MIQCSIILCTQASYYVVFHPPGRQDKKGDASTFLSNKWTTGCGTASHIKILSSATYYSTTLKTHIWHRPTFPPLAIWPSSFLRSPLISNDGVGRGAFVSPRGKMSEVQLTSIDIDGRGHTEVVQNKQPPEVLTVAIKIPKIPLSICKSTKWNCQIGCILVGASMRRKLTPSLRNKKSSLWQGNT